MGMSGLLKTTENHVLLCLMTDSLAAEKLCVTLVPPYQEGKTGKPGGGTEVGAATMRQEHQVGALQFGKAKVRAQCAQNWENQEPRGSSE